MILSQLSSPSIFVIRPECCLILKHNLEYVASIRITSLAIVLIQSLLGKIELKGKVSKESFFHVIAFNVYCKKLYDVR